MLGPFAHGVASGDPLADGVILWTRVTLASSTSTSPVDVEYVVATEPSLAASSVVAGGRFTTDATRDYTVKVDVGGLKPATTYYYRFAVASASSGAVAAGVSPVGRTRTLPVGSVDRVRVAVASCASLAHGYFNAYRRIAERADLDLVVHLGDYIYEYGDGDYGSLRPYEPSHEIVSLADYRQRHAQYKRDTDVQALHRQHAMVAIWDDHEFADNAWSGGAANHTEGAEGTWTARVAAALQAYYEWMPVRRVDAAEPRAQQPQLRPRQPGRAGDARGAAAGALEAARRQHRVARQPVVHPDRRLRRRLAAAARRRRGELAGDDAARLDGAVEAARPGRHVRPAQDHRRDQCRRRRHVHQSRPVGRLPAGARPRLRHPQGRQPARRR